MFAAVFVRLAGRFEIQPEHFVERHGADAADAALAAWPAAVAVDAAAGIALLTAMVAVALITKQATVKA